MMRSSSLLVLAALCLLSTSAFAMVTTVAPHGQQCFSETAVSGEKMHCSFMVTSGGFLDINVRIYNPDGSIVFENDREMEGALTFVTQKDGVYKFCFDNNMSTVTSKEVSFDIHVGRALTAHGVAKKEHFTPLENSVLILSEGLKNVLNEQKYYTTRERACRDTNESTNSRVLWFNIFETVVLVGMGLWQVMYIRSLFEQK